jgi:hypothetical protein
MRSRLFTGQLALLACLAVTACGSDSSSPTSSTGTANVTATNSAAQVPFSGVPITDAPECATRPNTWFFTTVLTETNGVAVSITSTVNSLDGSAQPAVSGNISIGARGAFTLNRRFCFLQPTQHTVQSTFSGTDANGHAVTVTAPVITLLAKP